MNFDPHPHVENGVWSPIFSEKNRVAMLGQLAIGTDGESLCLEADQMPASMPACRHASRVEGGGGGGLQKSEAAIDTLMGHVLLEASA